MTVRFIHIRNAGVPIATLAIADTGGERVDVALAICSPRDQFSRARGRDIALGRLACFRPDRPWVARGVLKVKVEDALEQLRRAPGSKHLALVPLAVMLGMPTRRYGQPSVGE